jgi:hypothetical protein
MQQCRALEPSQVGLYSRVSGLASAAATVHVFYFYFFKLPTL